MFVCPDCGEILIDNTSACNKCGCPPEYLKELVEELPIKERFEYKGEADINGKSLLVFEDRITKVMYFGSVPGMGPTNLISSVTPILDSDGKPWIAR